MNRAAGQRAEAEDMQVTWKPSYCLFCKGWELTSIIKLASVTSQPSLLQISKQTFKKVTYWLFLILFYA